MAASSIIPPSSTSITCYQDLDRGAVSKNTKYLSLEEITNLAHSKILPLDTLQTLQSDSRIWSELFMKYFGIEIPKGVENLAKEFYNRYFSFLKMYKLLKTDILSEIFKEDHPFSDESLIKHFAIFFKAIADDYDAEYFCYIKMLSYSDPTLKRIVDNFPYYFRASISETIILKNLIKYHNLKALETIINHYPYITKSTLGEALEYAKESNEINGIEILKKHPLFDAR